MIQKEIKNLIFDFGGVLIDLDRGRCVERFAQLGLERVEEMLGLYYQQDFFQQYEKGLISSAAFRDEIRAKSSRPLTDAEIDDAWNSFLVSIPSYKLDMLLELRRHYRVCLLSNTNEIHWLWSCANAFRCKDYGVDDYFERIYLSYEMRLAKPDAEIFRRVLADAGMRAEETLFIDDSAENCQSAASLGLSTYTPKPHEDWRPLFR